MPEDGFAREFELSSDPR